MNVVSGWGLVHIWSSPYGFNGDTEAITESHLPSPPPDFFNAPLKQSWLRNSNEVLSSDKTFIFINKKLKKEETKGTYCKTSSLLSLVFCKCFATLWRPILLQLKLDICKICTHKLYKWVRCVHWRAMNEATRLSGEQAATSLLWARVALMGKSWQPAKPTCPAGWPLLQGPWAAHRQGSALWKAETPAWSNPR